MGLMPMHVEVITLFPEFVGEVVRHGVTGRAATQDLIRVGCRNPREFVEDPHRTVDDRPYGGGPGMVMMHAPLAAAIGAARGELPAGSPVVYLTPQGERFDQRKAEQLAAAPGLVLVAGRYEGIDERLIETEVDEELSLGDFVLSGGELAAMVVIDAIARLLPGALGDELSAAQDSFSNGLLDCPHYTRPEEVAGLTVPEVLKSGDHERIRRWRLKQALGRTALRRPDLLEQRDLDAEELALLAEYKQEHGID